MSLTAVILTLNESRHLPRCLASLEGVVDHVLVVDSFSSDETACITESHGAKFVQHAFVNHASQFNWALTRLDEDTHWVLRIDADEYLTPELAAEIRERLPSLGAEINGVFCRRRMIFQGRLIRFGGLFHIRILRLFRYGSGRCENRWMDEHVKVTGPTTNFRGALIDDNLNSLTWWSDKHNRYASREAVEMLNLKYGFLPIDSIANLANGSQTSFKRLIKEQVYARLPGGFRAFTYFFYRYVIRLGFLDGRAGGAFHVLQGFWYRYLVDVKVAEVERYMREHRCDVVEAIAAVLDIRLEDQTRQRCRNE
jgi:glycosyltransferase involved in cell wall biosynthesis